MRKFNPWGLLVLAVGVLLLLQAAGIETAGIWELFWKIVWPVVVILCGLCMCYSARRITLWGFGLAVLGGWWLLARLGVLPGLHWGFVLAVAVILVGLQMLFGRGREVHVDVEVGGDRDGQEQNEARESAGGADAKKGRSYTFSEDGFVRSTAICWGDERAVGGDTFRGGSLTAVMGGIDLTLLGFEQFAEDAVINVTCVMGGIELIVPRNVRVINNVTGILGGTEVKGVQSGEPNGTLRITGTCIMGGVDIKQV